MGLRSVRIRGMCIFALCLIAYAQSASSVSADALTPQAELSAQGTGAAPAAKAGSASGDRITVDFKEADIRNVLKVISYKSGVNIVASPEVAGVVTMRLADVPWLEALKTIISAYGYGYDQRESIIIVAPLDKLTEQKKQEVELSQVQPTLTEVFALKYIDAADAQRAIEPQLSARGRITVLQSTGQAGWEFGAGDDTGKRERASEGRVSRSKTLIITDVPPALDKIRKIMGEIDKKPQQILIETRIVEANKDRLRDIGIDWGTGSSGASSSSGALTFTPAGKSGVGNDESQIGGHLLSDLVTPAAFGPEATGITTANTGLRVAFRRLSGAQFEAILHALEEDVTANTLSAPRIVTLNNQEATILVGQKYPILETQLHSETGKVQGGKLKEYKDIGIQLNVVPQICDNEYINMIVHPAVTSRVGDVGIKTDSGVTAVSYPLIDSREAETQVMIRDGETIVIGGLLKDVKTRGRQGIPFLGSIPIIGLLFQRQTNDIEKIDLLIFITARVLKEGEFTDAYIATLEERLNTLGPKKKRGLQKPPL